MIVYLDIIYKCIIMNKAEHTYNIWKCNSNCEPIEGTDRIIKGPSLRWIMRQIAFENKVDPNQSYPIVKLSNGEFYAGRIRY